MILLLFIANTFALSGCLFAVLGYTGAMVTAATVDQYVGQESNSTTTTDLDEYLEEQRRLSDKLSSTSCQESEKNSQKIKISTFLDENI